MIRLNDIVVKFGDFTALHGINVHVKEGEFFTFLGPSGCGKTTTLRTITGFIEPVEGAVVVKDRDITHVPIEDRNIGIVFQSYALFPTMTVYDNIAFGLKVKKVKRAEIDQRVRDIARKVDLSDEQLQKAVSQLSGGQQQRVAIARTLAPEPTVLFMDEPLSNLDAKLRLEMRSELQRLHLETGSTFVYVTHDQMEAMTLATKICLIDNGVLQQYDAPLDVYGKPANLFVADFVGNPAINFIEAKGSQNADGSVVLTALGGKSLVFRPDAPLDLADWFRKADAADAARKEAESARASQKGSVEKGNKDTMFRYHVAKVNEEEDFGDEVALTDEDLVLGIRPEFLSLNDSGALEGEIYSAMPTGMETTVKVRIGEFLLTGVVFGGVLYQIGEKVHLDFRGSEVVLFSRKNGRLITRGSLTVQ